MTLTHSASVSLNPDSVLATDITTKFKAALDEYDNMFDPNFKGYNGASRPFEAHVNIGPEQHPKRKGQLPEYAHSQLLELQEKFDTLERQGVVR